MKEYKRQKRDLEDQNADLLKRCEFHDDHLRTIDAWFAQLLDEVRVMASETLPIPPSKATDAGRPPPTKRGRGNHMLSMLRRGNIHIGAAV